MADINSKNNSIDSSYIDYGPTVDPFMYGWSTESGYKSTSTDKYVTSGSFNSQTSELDLQVKGADTVKINLSGVTTSDKHVTDGSSTINKDEQTLTLNIGDEQGVKAQVSISLSGIGETYSSKEEVEAQVGEVDTKVETVSAQVTQVETKVDDIDKKVDERLTWGEF